MPPKKKMNSELREKLRNKLEAKKIGRMKLHAQDEVLDDLEKKASGKSSSAAKAKALLEMAEQEIEEIDCKQNDGPHEPIGYD